MTSTSERAERLVAAAHDRLYNRHPHLRPAPPAVELPREPRLVLGRDVHGLPFTLDAETRCEHADIVGATKSGKSKFFCHSLWQDIEAGNGVILLDPHGSHPDSTFRTTLSWLVSSGRHRRRTIHIIDPNSRHCCGLNLVDGAAQPWVIAGNVMEAFERTHGDEETEGRKPTLRRSIQAIVANLAELGWTLAEAELLLDPDDPDGVRARALETVTDRYCRKELERLDRLARDPRLRKDFEVETIGAINRLAPLLSTPALRACLGQKDRAIDMRRAFDQGHIILANLSGGDAVYETGGDLLGKLLVRAIVYAAKRREGSRLVAVYADEVARYLSNDWERALAELRKYRVGFHSAHQTFAMLGKPDDPARQAIEHIPFTKIAFRLNSMREATELAPEIMKLNLEMPIEALSKPTVVGFETVKMKNAGTNASKSKANSVGVGAGFNAGVNASRGFSAEVSDSTSETKGTNRAVSQGESHSRGVAKIHLESDTESESETTSTSDNTGTSNTRRGTKDPDDDPDSVTESQNSGTTAASTRGSSHTVTDGTTTTETHGTSRQTTKGASEADTTGHTSSSGTNSSIGTNGGFSVSGDMSIALQNARGWVKGWSEALKPVLKNMPSAVHGLENVKHMAAELLCSLPTGVAIVRTVVDGKIEGAVVAVPLRETRPVSNADYESLLAEVMATSPSATLLAEAIAVVDKREQEIIAAARPMKTIPAPEDPETFRVPAQNRER